ncbi:hypothetical protein [Okeania sp. SIO2B3]|uniref:hypothetical protein n=1 Tax=Okeania sp. SIO2B3 TaxID=2607784 RepID=UPI0013C005AD|nr:hypothetical protein [Okeania sp. SIO2B3]NET41804.1 hypothetical protein [Okeania sp. SIO2B3]
MKGVFIILMLITVSPNILILMLIHQRQIFILLGYGDIFVSMMSQASLAIAFYHSH